MPIYETTCGDCGSYRERYEHHAVDKDPACLRCGGKTVRLVSGFASPLMGEISSKYIDRSIPGSEKLKDGAHWGWRKKSSISGKPEPVRLETFQQQRDFCRAEGLLNPSEVPRYIEPHEDGRGSKSSQGMPGAWV